MDSATVITHPHAESLIDATSSAVRARAATLAVSASYLLSEEGRKASLLAGGDGRATQDLTIHVPATRMHLVSVDANGVARLKLQPRYQLNDEQRVVRLDAPPTYDAPPDLEELFREAARNHQLATTYDAQHQATRSQQQASQRHAQTHVATAFLTDPTQRALLRPPPTPKRCVVPTPDGRVLFDADRDRAPARDVPQQALQRFQDDQRARRERNLQARTAQDALHREKKRYMAEWIAAHGTPEQQARHAVGMLSIQEAIEALTDVTFLAYATDARYVRIDAAILQAHLHEWPGYAEAIVRERDVVVTAGVAKKATAAQWAFVNELRTRMPAADVVLRVHWVCWRHGHGVPALAAYSVLVSATVGPFVLRREYRAPDAPSTRLV